MRSIWIEMTKCLRLFTESPTLNRPNAVRTMEGKPHGLIIAGLMCAALASTMVPAIAQQPGTPPLGRSPARGSFISARPDANPGQLMKGILFPNSHVRRGPFPPHESPITTAAKIVFRLQLAYKSIASGH